MKEWREEKKGVKGRKEGGKDLKEEGKEEED
jgi:hypothetical protein